MNRDSVKLTFRINTNTETLMIYQKLILHSPLRDFSTTVDLRSGNGLAFSL